MPYETIGKLILFSLCGFSVIYSSLTIHKKKKHFQIFPDSLKKDYYKTIRMMSLANILSAVLILVAGYLFASNFTYILLVISMFLSVGALYGVYEELGDLDD